MADASIASRRGRAASVCGLLTWLVLGATFVGLLGGMGPGDALRDRVIAVAIVLVVVLSVPSVLVVAQGFRRRQANRALYVSLLALVVRLGVAVWTFWFIHGISQERAP